MKDKFNKVVATGLVALMVANFTACGNTEFPSNNGTASTDKVSTNNKYETSINKDNHHNQNSNSTVGLSGSVWEALQKKGLVNYSKFAFEGKTYAIEASPVPLTFLESEGVIYYDNSTKKYKVNGELQPNDYYEPVEAVAFVDSNTEENDVYIITQFKSGQLEHGRNDIFRKEDVYIATWQLKYTLDDDDYRTLLRLGGDWRARLFIQEMDKQYQPEVLSKAVVMHNMLNLANHVSSRDWLEWNFPYTFISNVDYENAIITFGDASSSKVKYIQVDITQTPNWKYLIEEHGYTEKDCWDGLTMKTISTPAGDCLKTFEVDYYVCGISRKEAEERFKNTTNIKQFSSVNINAVKNNEYFTQKMR